jgi:hypothetical protein
MDCGFETIGNATLIIHDKTPLLATDPWLTGDAYFGSWTLSHEIPEAQLEAVLACPFVWVSHGHPDHLHVASLAMLKHATILVPAHRGGRIERDLRDQGHTVVVLPDRQWTSLSSRVRVMCIADFNQDAVLLVDVAGKLVVNLNDASDRGWGRLVKKVVAGYPVSFLLAFAGSVDADMINFYDEGGRRVRPAPHGPTGPVLARRAEELGVRYAVPFSCMHKVQRADSLWASEHATPLSELARGFSSKTVELLPPFLRYDALRDRAEPIRPRERTVVPLHPADVGDRWDEPLDALDRTELDHYFRCIEHLGQVLDFVRLRVAGRDHTITLGPRRHDRGLTFEAPRQSLMTAVHEQIFDQLLIGNFMRTTLHGDLAGLYPDISPYIAKYADVGGARSEEELRAYFASYRDRDRMGFLRHQLDRAYVRPLQARSAELLRTVLPAESRAFQAAKRTYWTMRRALL